MDKVVGWARACRGLIGIFCIQLPCLILLALPAMAAGYAWRWIVGGFRWGEIMFDEDGSADAVDTTAGEGS